MRWLTPLVLCFVSLLPCLAGCGDGNATPIGPDHAGGGGATGTGGTTGTGGAGGTGGATGGGGTSTGGSGGGTNPDPCAGVDCSGHGLCAVRAGAALCVCDNGYRLDSARTCVKIVDSCNGIDCSGHGKCVIDNGLATCQCDEVNGWFPKGADCIDPCASVTCSGHGTCKAISGIGVCACNFDRFRGDEWFPAGPNGCVSTRPGHALPVGGDTWTVAMSIAKTSDGGYIVLVDGGPNQQLFFSLVKLSSTLSIEWTKQFDCGEWDEAYNAQQTPDGGYIILGRHYYLNNTDLNTMFVIKTDSAGGKLWEKDFLKSDLGMTGIGPNWIEVAADGGLIASVFPQRLVKLSNAGDLQWSTPTSEMWTTQVKNVPGGGYMLAHGFGLLKTDGQGTELFSKTYANDSAGSGSLAMTPDGGWVVAGYSSDPANFTNVHFAKADAAGTLLWERVLGASGYRVSNDAKTVDVTATGDIYVGGHMASAQSNFFLAKVDSIGTPIWLFTYASNLAEDGAIQPVGTCRSVVATPSGGAICVGRGGGTNGAWLLEVDANGVPLP